MGNGKHISESLSLPENLAGPANDSYGFHQRKQGSTSWQNLSFGECWEGKMWVVGGGRTDRGAKSVALLTLCYFTGIIMINVTSNLSESALFLCLMLLICLCDSLVHNDEWSYRNYTVSLYLLVVRPIKICINKLWFIGRGSYFTVKEKLGGWNIKKGNNLIRWHIRLI